MATAALTNVPTTIDLAEATTNWNGDTFSLEPDIKVQGSNSVACVMTPAAGASQQIWVSGTWDFTGTGVGEQHVRLWVNASWSGNMQTEANDGIAIFLSDGTNESRWTVAGSDTYAGGWVQFVIYTGDTPTNTSGTLNKAAITQIGLHFEALTKPRNVPANTWCDAWYFGDGYTVTGGATSDELDWTHIASVDETNAYNIVSVVDDVVFLAGEVTIGDGISTTYFYPNNQLVMFKDLAVLSTLYQIIFFDDASALTNIDITGGAWSAAGTQRYTIDASETTINAFSMTGVQVGKADTSSFHAGATVTGNVFNDCLQITPSTSTFQNNTISGYTGTGAAVLAPTSVTLFKDNIYTDNTDVTNNPSAIEFDTVGTYDSNGDTFSGNDFDILNSDAAATITAGSFVIGRGYKILTVGTTDYTLIGSADNVIGTKFVATGVGTGTGTATEVLVLNKTNSSNPSTASNTGTNSDTLFVGSVPVDITVLDDDTGLAIGTDCRVHVVLSSDKSVILSAACNASGIASTSYSGATPVNIEGWAREFSITGTDYVAKDFSGEISTTGFALTVRLSPVV